VNENIPSVFYVTSQSMKEKPDVRINLSGVSGKTQSPVDEEDAIQ